MKDRLATHYLVQRATSAATSFAEKRAAAQKNVSAASEKLAGLAARCERDPDTEKLLIPPQLADPYAKATAERQAFTKEIHRIDRRERALAEQLGARLIDATRIGRAEIPAFRRLGAVPPDIANVAASASDDALAEAVSAALAEQLRVTLPPVVASEPVDISGRRRDLRPGDAPTNSPADLTEADQALALRPEDSMADVVAMTEGMELEE